MAIAGKIRAEIKVEKKNNSNVSVDGNNDIINIENIFENTNVNGSINTEVEEIVQKTPREVEKEMLAKMETQYRAEKNKVPNAGDLTILVLKSITVVSVIALIVVIVCSRKVNK